MGREQGVILYKAVVLSVLLISIYAFLHSKQEYLFLEVYLILSAWRWEIPFLRSRMKVKHAAKWNIDERTAQFTAQCCSQTFSLHNFCSCPSGMPEPDSQRCVSAKLNQSAHSWDGEVCLPPVLAPEVCECASVKKHLLTLLAWGVTGRLHLRQSDLWSRAQ